MEIPVLIERIGENGYRARSGEPLACSVEAPTREEAMKKIQDEMAVKLQAGTELVAVAMPAEENPWIKHAGMFKDDPMFDEVVRIMEENRRQWNADPGFP